MESLETRIGARLKRLRKREGLTQEALAEQAGISRVFEYYIEAGERLPTLRTLDRLARTLGLSLEGFFGARTVKKPKRRGRSRGAKR